MAGGYIDWLRARVGPQKILLVFASTCIVDDEGRVLWQRRGDFGWWGLPGGVLELDEDLATCAVREAKEETGLDIAIAGLIGVYSSPEFDVVYPNGDEVQQVTFCFAASPRGGRLAVDGIETLDLRWRSPDDPPETSPWYETMVADLAADRAEATFRAGSPGTARAAEPYFRRMRRHIGQGPLITAAALAAVFDGDGRIMLVRRADDGSWSLPGGMLEPGERIDQTVVNEVREETGLGVRPVRLVGVFSNADYRFRYPNGDEVKAVSCLFRCELDGEAAPSDARPDMEEVTAIGFFGPDELPDLPHRYATRVAAAFADAPRAIIS